MSLEKHEEFPGRNNRVKKPWAGRFSQKTSQTVEAFTESITFDKRLWKHDIEGSIAHARMLGKQGIISLKESMEIEKGLREIASEIESGRFRFREDLEDVHMNIEAALTGKIGAVGGKLHTARSRNDQVALDLRLYLREETLAITGLIRDLQKALLKAAGKHTEAIMPGYTHLQRAQPVLLSHHLLAYIEMLDRDRERYKDSLKRTNVLPLGSCALAGTTLPTDRAYVAKLLGFDAVSANSIDAVSDRDFAIEFLSCSAIMVMHLSRFAEELVLWSSEEFRFVEISDRFTTGSSIMPQKKNPDVAELMRGKTGRVYGALISLLTLMKGLPLSYNRDMQEDKVPVFDTTDTIKSCLTVLTEMLPEIRFNTSVMQATAGEGFSTATDIAEYLVRKKLPFRHAHEITGKIVRYCLQKKKKLHELSIDEFREFSGYFNKDIMGLLSPSESVRTRKSFGSASPAGVKKRIDYYAKALKKK